MSKKKITNSADEAQVKESASKEKFNRETELNDLRAVLSTPEGRRVLWRYMAPIYRLSADNSGSWTYFNEGERNVALRIQADCIEASQDFLFEMMKEAQKGELNV